MRGSAYLFVEHGLFNGRKKGLNEEKNMESRIYLEGMKENILGNVSLAAVCGIGGPGAIRHLHVLAGSGWKIHHGHQIINTKLIAWS